MTIIHISTSLESGGAEQMVYQLAKNSHSKGINTITLSVNTINTLEHKFKQNNLEYHYLGINSFKNSSLRNGLKTMHEVVSTQTNVVFHGHQFHGCLLGILYNIIYLKRIPIVFTLHTRDVAEPERRMFLFFTKWLRKSDIIFSENTKKWYLKNNAVIPNGVDFNSFNSSNNPEYVKSKIFSFLYLGRLSAEKNPLQLIKCALDLRNKGIKEFIIDVVGDGNLREELENQIRENKLNSFFRLHGFQDNIIKHLLQSHCLVLTSHLEGMPVALVEAAAAKLPIIATPVGSIPEMLSKDNGFVSSLEEFSKNMEYVIINYDKALEKAELFHNEVKLQYDINTVSNTHLKVYESALGN